MCLPTVICITLGSSEAAKVLPRIIDLEASFEVCHRVEVCC